MAHIKYLIDVEQSLIYKNLVIRLIESETNQAPNNSSSFSYLKLKQLISPQEKELLESLLKEEIHYLKNTTGRAPHLDTMPISLIHISSQQTIPLLKRLGETHKLYFKEKQLVCDFYAKVELYFLIEPLPNNQIKVEARLKWRQNDINLQDCDWVGSGKPHWFIQGLSLKTISTDIPWKYLQKAFQTKPWILSEIEKINFLEELDEDPDSPKVIYAKGSKEDVHKSPDPIPLLILKDRSGAFADLWMDYGTDHLFPFNEWKLEKTTFKRNLESEKNLEKDLLETDFIKKDVGSSHYYCPLDKVTKSLSFLLEIGWPIKDAKGQRIVKQQNLDLSLQEGTNKLILTGKVNYQGHETDIVNVIGAFNRRERFVQLASGTVGLIEEQGSISEIAEEGELVSDSIHFKKSKIGALSTLIQEIKVDPVLEGLRERLQNFSQIENAFPSPLFQGQLRPYQQEGVNWLSFLVQYGLHGILADDMGLGKTVQVLALLSRLNGLHLIVVPTSLLFNWKNEIEKFLPSYKVYIHQGSKRLKNVDDISNHKIIITSYATLRQDLSLFEKISFFSVILDEAQAIKNAHTQTSKAVCQIQSQFRLSITGTPIENHLNELWSHFRFLIPDLFGDETSFESDLQAAEADNRYIKRIKKKILPFVLRRKKEDVAKDLPERIDQIVWIDMPETQRQIYDRFLASVKGNLLKKVDIDGIGKHRMEIFEVLLRLRQICCHPLLISSMLDDTESLESAKFDALFQDLETAIEENGKVLIYSQFTSMLQLMSKKAHENGWQFAYLDGSTVNREKVVKSFQDDPRVNLFFVSLKAGGVGLNLTAADYVFLYDPWWNDAAEEQAINRAHRIGRKDTVFAKRYVLLESIEEKMMKLKATKKNLIDEVMNNEENNLQMTVDDLRYLLN